MKSWILETRSFEDFVSSSKSILHLKKNKKHYYYTIWQKSAAWIAYIAYVTDSKIKAKYVCIDSSGRLILSETPDDPTFKPIIDIESDPLFEKAIR